MKRATLLPGIFRKLGIVRLLPARAQAEMVVLVVTKIGLAILDLLLAALLFLLFSLLQKQGPGGPRRLATIIHFPHSFNALACATIVVLCMRMAGDFYVTGWTCRFSQKLYVNFMLSLLKGYLAMRWDRYTQRNRSDFIRHCMTTALDAAYGFQILQEFAASGVVTVLLLVAAFRVSVLAGIAMVGLGAALLAFHRGVLREQLAGASRGRDEALSQLQMRTAELFSLARECAIYGNDDFFVRSIRGHASRLQVSNQRLAQLPQVPKMMVDYGSMILFVAVIAAAYNMRSNVSHLISLLVFYFVLSRRLLPTISQLVMVAGQFDGLMPSIRLVQEQLSGCEDDARVVSEPSPYSSLPGLLVLDGVTLSYGTGGVILDKIDCVVKAGECIVLRGPSGTGKSSLLYIAGGLLTPSSGRVACAVEKSGIAYVPQDVVLFDGTVRDNIVFGMLDRGDEAVWNALRIAQIDAYIRTLPDGLHSRTGDNGVMLSGGQRQRLGIARAIYRNPLLLLLDEATAALDADNESRLLNSIGDAFPATALLMVTHRPYVPEYACRAFRLVSGKLVEEHTKMPETSRAVALGGRS